MRLTKPRIPALHEDQWDAEQAEILSGKTMRG